MGLLYLFESDNLTLHVVNIQAALWSTGRSRAAGSSDTLTAAYALEHNQTIVTCDVDFVHIARAREKAGTHPPVRVIHIKDTAFSPATPPPP